MAGRICCTSFYACCCRYGLTRDHIYLPKSNSTLYRVRYVCYADDLQLQARTLRALQRMADLVSVYALVFNLSIAFKKLRVFHYCGIFPLFSEFLVLHLAGWRAQSVPIRTSGTFLVVLALIILLTLLTQRLSSPVKSLSVLPYTS